MIIVAGHLTVAPADRDSYVADCTAVVRLARSAPGCLDFSISPDLLDPARVNVHERWASASSLESFRGSGPSGPQQEAIVSADVREWTVA
jgi:quinol monooxygenase YgiN